VSCGRGLSQRGVPLLCAVWCRHLECRRIDRVHQVPCRHIQRCHRCILGRDLPEVRGGKVELAGGSTRSRLLSPLPRWTLGRQARTQRLFAVQRLPQGHLELRFGGNLAGRVHSLRGRHLESGHGCHLPHAVPGLPRRKMDGRGGDCIHVGVHPLRSWHLQHGSWCNQSWCLSAVSNRHLEQTDRCPLELYMSGLLAGLLERHHWFFEPGLVSALPEGYVERRQGSEHHECLQGLRHRALSASGGPGLREELHRVRAWQLQQWARSCELHQVPQRLLEYLSWCDLVQCLSGRHLDLHSRFASCRRLHSLWAIECLHTRRDRPRDGDD